MQNVYNKYFWIELLVFNKELPMLTARHLVVSRFFLFILSLLNAHVRK
jgi:hypothetical protein